MSKCPRCESPQPHLHPAMQFEGEVQLCLNPFHLTPTPQNAPRGVEMVRAERARRGYSASVAAPVTTKEDE